MNRDVDRFDRWAHTYDRHWMQRRIFEPIQRAVLDLAAAEVASPRAILDVGCGTGRLLRAAAARFPAAQLTGLDPAPEMIREARLAAGEDGRIEFEQGFAEALPFAGARFDVVFSTMTFHHWRDRPHGAAEVRRVLAPGGRWLLADFVATGLMRPLRRLLRLRQFPDRDELETLLRASGLSVAASTRVPGLGGQVAVLAVRTAD